MPRISAKNLEVDLSDLKVEQAGKDLSVSAAGTTALGASKLSMPKVDTAAGGENAGPLGLAFSQATLDLTRMLLTSKEGKLRLDAQPRLSVDGFELGGPAEAAAEHVGIELETLDVTTEVGDLSATTSGRANLSALQARIAGESDPFPVEMDLGLFNVELEEGGWAATGAESSWRARFDTKLESFAATLGEGSVGRAKVRELMLEGGSADQTMSLAADNLTIGGLDVDFNQKLFSAPEIGEDGNGQVTEQTKDTSPSPVIKLQRFALSDDASIRFSDTSVTPNVAMNVDIEELQLAGLDTADPSQKTDLLLALTVNEFSKIRLSGWLQAMNTPKPSFDIDAEAENVQLAPFSPYAAKAVGLYLESGKLDLNAEVAAAAGKLDGTIKLNVLDLEFSPLSPEDAERISAKVGLPIETAVGLLQDSDNRIRLALPVSGTVSEPAVDLSQAIGKAVGGALKSIFPPTAIASLISSGLEGAGKAGLQFKPIPFAAGEAALGPEGGGVADNVAKLLEERPKLRLKVCGRATAADLDAYLATALSQKKAPQPAPSAAPPAAPAASPAPAAPAGREQLLDQARSDLTELATKRGREVRQYVVGEHGLRPDSLGECRSTFDSTDQGPPRAEVRL